MSAWLNRIAVYTAGVATGLLLGSGVTVAQETVLFENATVFVGDGSLIENGAVLVEGDSIIAVAQLAAMTVPSGTRHIDLAGKFIMPAMLDAHAHLGYQSPEGWGSEYYSADNLKENLRQYAYYGFSAAFSAGSDPDDLALALQAGQRAEPGPAARLLIAAGMGPPGQGPNDAFLEEIADVETATGMTVLRGIDSPVAAIMQVRDVAAKGIPVIKIWVDDRGGSQDKLSPDLFLPLIAEAMRQRIDVVVHQQVPADMMPLLEAGASGFLHGRLGPALGSEIAAATAAASAFIVPNLGLGELRREAIGRDPFLREVLPSATRERISQGPRQASPELDDDREAALRQSLRHLLDAGVDIVLGTDAGALPDHPFGYTGHRELEIYVRLGMSPMQALVAATGAAARHLKQEDLGLIAPGRRASLLILDASPLNAIRNTRRIHSVYLNGVEVDRAAVASELSAP